MSDFLGKDAELIYSEEYNKEENGAADFLMLTNDLLNADFNIEDNSICIYKNWRKGVSPYPFPIDTIARYSSVIWQAEHKPVRKDLFVKTEDEAKNDFDGEKRTKELLSSYDNLLEKYNKQKNVTPLKKEDYLPAIIRTDGKILMRKDDTSKRIRAFLPSIGQLITISKNVVKINEALKKIGSEPLPTIKNPNQESNPNEFVLKGCWWSSSEFDAGHAWALKNGIAIPSDKLLSENLLFPIYHLSF